MPSNPRRRIAFAAIAFAILSFGIASCGGQGITSSEATSDPPPLTGTFTITVTAAEGSESQVLTFKLNVTQ